MTTIEECQNKDEIEKIISEINFYNDSQTERVLPDIWTPIELIAKNNKREIVGGVIGGVGYYAGFMIKTLWVDESVRKRGLGAKLLKQAEETAIEKGAKLTILETFSFQAEGFYLKQGYENFGKIEDFPKKGQNFLFLKKAL